MDDSPTDEVLTGEAVTVRAWQVADTGLVAVPGRFRRLPGAVRHHQGQGERWPDQVTLILDRGRLTVAGTGEWPVDEVSVRRVSAGPPVTFVIEVPAGAHMLAAAGDQATELLLAALGA